MLSQLCRNILIITNYEYFIVEKFKVGNCSCWEVNQVENYLMVAEHRHLSVSSVVGQHLGRHIVIWVSQLVQLLLQCVGGVVCPAMGN